MALFRVFSNILYNKKLETQSFESRAAYFISFWKYKSLVHHSKVRGFLRFRPNMIHFFKSHVLKLALRLFEKDISMVLRQRIKRLLMEKRARGILIFCSEEPVKEFEKYKQSSKLNTFAFSPRGFQFVSN